MGRTYRVDTPTDVIFYPEYEGDEGEDAQAVADVLEFVRSLNGEGIELAIPGAPGGGKVLVFFRAGYDDRPANHPVVEDSWSN